MIHTPAGGVAHVVRVLVRRADAGLALGAARNAAASVADVRARRLEELRTLRDLAALDDAATPRRLPRRAARG